MPFERVHHFSVEIVVSFDDHSENLYPLFNHWHRSAFDHCSLGSFNVRRKTLSSKKATDNHNQWLLLEFGTLCVLALTWTWRLNTARFLFMLWPSSQWLRVPFATARSYEISGTYIPTGTETLKDFWSCFQTPGFTLWTGFLDWPMRLHEILSEGPKSFSIELRMLRNISASLLCATSEMVI